ncbi:hypothetical protein EYF80_050258 [Liparis tanakae]|uniref:Uncharacterized protein n=1 Tax=Liparis tanakae TaxID=230148 RepID=A0A4Z2FEB2_9TELE|nr:hypothetical protein EYF80_050258 [Liparis tanakae]
MVSGPLGCQTFFLAPPSSSFVKPLAAPYAYFLILSSLELQRFPGLEALWPEESHLGPRSLLAPRTKSAVSSPAVSCHDDHRCGTQRERCQG